MENIKTIIRVTVVGVVLLQILLLTSCAGHVVPATDLLDIKKQCQSGNLIVTDLTKPRATRDYMLFSGQECSTSGVQTNA